MGSLPTNFGFRVLDVFVVDGKPNFAALSTPIQW
jgi:hypothetical protein